MVWMCRGGIVETLDKRCGMWSCLVGEKSFMDVVKEDMVGVTGCWR